MAKQRADADRRLRQNLRIARIFRLLQLVQGRGRWNARAIAQELDCSERTVYRDLNVLELAGVPWSYDGDHKCYCVRPDFRFPALNLTEDELVGQATATAITKAAGLNITEGARPTTRKLAAVSQEETEKLLHDAEEMVAVLDLKLADHSRHQEIIRTIQWSLLRGKQLTGQYASPYQSQAVRLTLHPYRLCLIKQAWYLIARPTAAQEPRTYRIPRFKTLRMIDAAAEVPKDFDLQRYFGNAWAVYRGEKTYDIEIVFTRESAPLVTETIWHSTQKVKWQRDGGVTLTFRVDGLTEILHWVLGWAGRAKVIKPKELRDLVVEQLRTALKMNEA